MCVSLQEFTVKDLKQGIDWRFLSARDRVRELRKRGTRYAGVRASSVFFRTFSSEYATNGIIYTQEIRLLDLKDALKMKDLLPSRRVLLAMAGDVAIRCTCPAFLYWGFSFVLTQLGASASRPEKRFPGIRNPQLRSTMCKHLALVMEVFGVHWNTVTRDLKKQGYF